VVVPNFSRAVLIVVDVQKAIDASYHASDGLRNNPDAEMNIARLLDAWRRYKRPIIHIRHDSTCAQSSYRPGQDGNDFKTQVAPASGESVIGKRTNSLHRYRPTARATRFDCVRSERSNAFVFKNRAGGQLTRFGVRYILRKYLPDYLSPARRRKIHPHSIPLSRMPKINKLPNFIVDALSSLHRVFVVG
jgi:hypothetical protein